MTTNYLNNSHHKELFSLGLRHMASVDVSSIHEFISYKSPLYDLILGTKIINFIKTEINTQKYLLFKPKSIKMTNGEVFKIVKTSNTWLCDKYKESINVKFKGGLYGTTDCANDGSFVTWYIHYHLFVSDTTDKFQLELDKLVLEYLSTIMHICLQEFHKEIAPGPKDPMQSSKEVKCRQITFAYWAAKTISNAILENGYDKLKMLAWMPAAKCVKSFENVCNFYNKTDYNYSELYYNDSTTKAEQKAMFEIVKAGLGI